MWIPSVKKHAEPLKILASAMLEVFTFRFGNDKDAGSKGK